MATPTALLVSCSPNVDPLIIMKEITGHDDEDPFSPIAEDVQGYPWQLSNKYYTADILVCVAEPCIMGSLTLGDSMEGIIIAMDDKEQSFKTAKSQWSTVKEINPEVRILACKQFTKTPGVTKQAAVEWCLDNAFELVELEKPEDEDEEEEDGFGVEPYGVKRIVSALHAHTWSNLEMKEDNRSHLLRLQERFAESDNQNVADNSTIENPTHNGYVPLQSDEDNSERERADSNQEDSDCAVLDSAAALADRDDANVRTSEPRNASGDSDVGGGGGGCHGNGGVAESSSAISGSDQRSCSGGAGGGEMERTSAANSKPDKIDAMLNEDIKLFEALGNEDPESESFEQLFSKMAYMKDKANALEGDERRRYAEKVAIAFWQAVGGDQEEIGGLDDDSD